MVNRHLLKDLIDRGLWDPNTRLQIIANRGSVQGITSIPDDLRELYKCVTGSWGAVGDGSWESHRLARSSKRETLTDNARTP